MKVEIRHLQTVCEVCGFVCTHLDEQGESTFENGECKECEYVCTHKDTDGKWTYKADDSDPTKMICATCGEECDHASRKDEGWSAEESA